MTPNLKNIIQAICNLDYQAVVEFLDDDALHYGATKELFVPYLKQYFKLMPIYMDCSHFEAEVMICGGCKIVRDYNELWDPDINYPTIACGHVILFRSPDGHFTFDIKPTHNGKFCLNSCTFNNGYCDIYIPEDLLDGREPGEVYNRLLAEKPKILAEIDNGEIVFWFFEDIDAFKKKYDWFFNHINEYTNNYFQFFEFEGFAYYLNSLHTFLPSQRIYQAANEAYSELNKSDIWAIYEWYYTHQDKKYEYYGPNIFDLSHIDQGYFTIKDFFPNLRFSYSGQQDFFTFITNMDEAYLIAEEIICEELFSEIEIEWRCEESEESDGEF